MRKYMLAAALAMTTVQIHAQYVISGNIAGYKGDVYMVRPTVTGYNDTLKHVVSANGTFSFKGQVEKPVMVKICLKGKNIRIPLFLEPQRYDIKGNTMRCDVTGGGTLQQLSNQFLQRKKKLMQERDSLKAEYEKEYGKDDLFGNLQIKGLYDTYEDLMSKQEDEFIKEHDNLVSACIVAERCSELSRKKLLAAKYELLGENARNTIQGKWLKPYAEKIARIVPGGIAPDLRMQTPEGKMMSLYDVKAKVKIIDFWASWCGPCRAENPNVRRIYEKYKDKGLEIISVSLDSKKEAWVNAIAADKLTWKHMSDLKGWKSIVTDVYEIHAVPTLFVLDADNRIIAEGLRGEALEKCVAEAIEK